VGYYTDFTVRIVEGDGDIKAVADAINGVSSYMVDIYQGAAHVNEAKWYDHVEDMRSVSELFPALLLEVEGAGEESHDIWAQRFRNGEASERVEAVLYFPWPSDALAAEPH